MDSFRRLWRLTALALLGAAVYKEYTKDPADRTGTGVVAGVVPYDFRPPTPAKIRNAFWNPSDERLFSPTVFGVGWAINFAALFAKLREKSQP